LKAKINGYGSSKALDVNRETVIRYLKRGLTAEEVASKFGVGRRTLFLWLKKQGLSIKKLQEEAKKELEQKYNRTIKRVDLYRLPVTEREEFRQLDVVQKVIDRMMSANLSKRTINAHINFWYRLSAGLIGEERILDPVHPIDALDPDRLTKYVRIIRERGYNVDAVKYALKTIAKWLEISLPPEFETSEYKGKYRQCELNVKMRYYFLKFAKELFPNEYDLIRSTAIFLFQSASRREALETAEILGYTKFKPIPEFNNETEFLQIRTREKGKKGRKIEWIKLIPKSFAEYITKLPLTQTEIENLRKMMKNILFRIYHEFYDELNEDTKNYINLQTAKGIKTKVFHIWRHTACRSALKSFKWKMYYVSKLLGWEKTENLKIYGDFTINQLLELETEEAPPFLYLYGEWLEKAKKEGLL